MEYAIFLNYIFHSVVLSIHHLISKVFIFLKLTKQFKQKLLYSSVVYVHLTYLSY